MTFSGNSIRIFAGLIIAFVGTPQSVRAVGEPIVSRHHSVFTEAPRKIPSNCSTDAPLLGNGDLLAALGGSAGNWQFHLSKADLWDMRPGGGPRRLAQLDIGVPEMAGASWQVDQDLQHAVTRGRFIKDGITLHCNAFVCATANTMVIELSVDGGSVHGTARLSGGDGKPAQNDGDLQTTARGFEKNKHPTGAACAVRVAGGAADGSFNVQPGKPVRVIVGACGLANAPGFPAEAARLAREGDITALRQAHEAWWNALWRKSFIEIPDKVLEQRYYLSHYCMASASRLAHFPPGLFPWVTTPAGQMWNGVYFNNYNLFAPFYGLYAANHIEQAMPCNDTILDAIELGRSFYQQRFGEGQGILLPTNMAPFGNVFRALTDHGQLSNASYACVPLASTWYATYDVAFARKAYPFVRAAADFWEAHLLEQNGRYVDQNDSVHEDSGNNLNPIVSLALIRQVMDLVIDMSRALDIDSDKHAKWRDIRDRMSDYPVCTVADLPKNANIAVPRTPENLALPIFRYSENGTAWQRENAVGIQHIFPGNGMGFGLRPELLERARNQITVLGRWIDFNGCNSFYPAAARVGYDPGEILKHLRHWVDTASPNGMRADNPHGSEQFSVVPNTLQEMLLQSFDGTLRFFPNWPVNQDARFGTLRARGAFLVSASLKNGVVTEAEIRSERGRDCAIINPWPGQKVRVMRGGGGIEFAEGESFSLKTSENEIIKISTQQSQRPSP